MKTKIKKMPYEQVLEQKHYEHKLPLKQWVILRWLLRIYTFFSLMRVRFSCEKIGMEKLPKKQPCLILMNHSSFVDGEVVARVFGNRPYQIVCTLDGFIGLNWIMRLLGCIATRKFVADIGLVKDMIYAVRELKSSVVMFPEAGYSFDGTATTLPDSIGKCIKLLQVPVVMVETRGAFLRTPLYNGLQNRKTQVSAKVSYVLSPEDIKNKTVEEINEVVKELFSFDGFHWQQKNKIRISEKFRADYLNRVLYKCPHCLMEGKTEGKGSYLTCKNCGAKYELTEYGYMRAVEGETKFSHIPDWYQWERACVRQELLDGTYRLDVPVDIYMLINTKCVYKVGEGNLHHTVEGFHLNGFEGKLDYYQSPTSTYSICSDFYWYEIDDVICIGNMKTQYYCVPKVADDIVAKTRLAAEELYKLSKK